MEKVDALMKPKSPKAKTNSPDGSTTKEFGRFTAVSDLKPGYLDKEAFIYTSKRHNFPCLTDKLSFTTGAPLPLSLLARFIFSIHEVCSTKMRMFFREVFSKFF